MTEDSNPIFFSVREMRLGELDEHTQYQILKRYLDGHEPEYEGKPVVIPNSITVRFTCSNYMCGKLIMPSYYKSDLENIPNRIMCPLCGQWATRHYMGATVDLQKEVKRTVQKRMIDYQ